MFCTSVAEGSYQGEGLLKVTGLRSVNVQTVEMILENHLRDSFLVYI